jgi:beta-lactamase class D
MASAAPVPLAGIAQNDFHPERFFKIHLKFMPLGFHNINFHHTHFLYFDAKGMVK